MFVPLVQLARHLGEYPQALRQVLDLLGVEFVDDRGKRRPARGPRLVGDALCGLGQRQPTDPSVVGVDRTNQQAVGREFGDQRRGGVGHEPELGRRLAYRDSRLPADEPKQFGLRLREAGGVEASARSSGAADAGIARPRRTTPSEVCACLHNDENTSVSEVSATGPARFAPRNPSRAPLRAMTWSDAAFLVAAGVVGGLAGSIAGLSSVATYPALLLVGLPPVTANVTNTVALVFNGVGSVLGSRPELKGQGPWLKRVLPVAAVAGAIGAMLLLSTPRQCELFFFLFYLAFEKKKTFCMYSFKLVLARRGDVDHRGRSDLVGVVQGSGNLALATTSSQAATLKVGGNGSSTTYTGIWGGSAPSPRKAAAPVALRPDADLCGRHERHGRHVETPAGNPRIGSSLQAWYDASTLSVGTISTWADLGQQPHRHGDHRHLYGVEHYRTQQQECGVETPRQAPQRGGQPLRQIDVRRLPRPGHDLRLQLGEACSESKTTIGIRATCSKTAARRSTAASIRKPFRRTARSWQTPST